MIPTDTSIPLGQGLEQQLLLLLLQMLSKPREEDEELKRLLGSGGARLFQHAGGNDPGSPQAAVPGGGPLGGGIHDGNAVLEMLYQMQKKAALRAALGSSNSGGPGHQSRSTPGL